MWNIKLQRLELPQKPYIILRIQPEVVYLEFYLCDALYPEPECIAGIYLGVYAKVAEHVGVYHTAAQYLYPAGMLAQAAAAATTYGTGNVHLGARLCEREVRGAEAHLGVFAKQFLHEMIQCLLEVGEGHIFINIQPLALVEEAMRTCRYGLVAVNPAGANDPDGQRLCFHYPCLHRGCVRAQYPIGVLGYVEGILHIARRVMLGHVERCEVVPVVFYLRPCGHAETYLFENRHYLILYYAQRVAGAYRQRCAGKGNINSRPLCGACLLHIFMGIELLLCHLLERIEEHTGFFALVGRDVLHFGRQLLDNTLGAEKAYTEILQFGGVLGLEGYYFGFVCLYLFV